MAAMGPEDRTGTRPDRMAAPPLGQKACTPTPPSTSHSSSTPDTPREGPGPCWTNLPLQILGPTMHLCTGEAAFSFRSPESVEMDEIMAAMVLTSLSCSPGLQSPPQTDPGLQSPPQKDPGLQSPPQTDPEPAPSSSADMECGGGELSDSGSSGYWSWDHGNVSPSPSPSITEADGSPDEGLQMDLDQGEELNAKKPKSSFRGVYKCLWPSCGKVLTSSVGIKRHIRLLHLGSSDQSLREEDFYYTRICCDAVDSASAPAPAPPPSQSRPQALVQSSAPHLSWSSCGSPSGSGLQIPPTHRSRSNSSSGPGPSRPGPLSQSAPGSFWQIHSEHLYQACSPVQVPVPVPVGSRSPSVHGWSVSTSVSCHSNPPVTKARFRSVSVGEQWLQQNRLTTVNAASPTRNHCSYRKARGEAKKCRKVYGLEQKDQWCTACRWKKACQRFPD
ncbi:zinc finger protein 395b isoform X2 [Sphaeramia orbicularis]|uniref:Zinc finger protein 395-like n=1 Tax=Sphaeramia orbicularis TaxID=375764 RepID=A0A673AS13_9TELE|nr:zinc finger protein 395-like isoform X2 [Sphaeramia orbicularis]